MLSYNNIFVVRDGYSLILSTVILSDISSKKVCGTQTKLIPQNIIWLADLYRHRADSMPPDQITERLAAGRHPQNIQGSADLYRYRADSMPPDQITERLAAGRPPPA